MLNSYEHHVRTKHQHLHKRASALSNNNCRNKLNAEMFAASKYARFWFYRRYMTYLQFVQ